ncbi:hypothetical protein E8P82_09825 [Arthrobacter echini]|uniref:Tetratricopeptide repeat protein n=1 Tax=Arthrobacter echini TaxID=1529066 RepID=A0A4S5E4E5_9MICC|nr:hypothetical protein [Arthrobacter echini]THJ66280.1 hypothetical protein E8P82_09825 [Arthrobacter echini]
MAYDEAVGARLLLELQARDAWNRRDYAGAKNVARQLASSAQHDGDDLSWWNATFLVSECARKQGMMRESAAIAERLADHPLTQRSKALSARVSSLISFALQGSGDLAPAIAAGRHAVEIASSEIGQPNILVEALNALIAALADSDQREAAWQESQSLAAILVSHPESPYAGQSYWAMGNVAFLLKQIDEGVYYHRLAAKTISPMNDLDLWSRFNRASASLRLSAGVVESETLECIERAEMANFIIGGTDRDREELKLTRAHWLVLTGQFDTATELLHSVIDHKDLVASHTAAQAHLLLGQALAESGSTADAITQLELGEDLFLQSGAQDRAATARQLIDDLQQR